MLEYKSPEGSHRHLKTNMHSVPQETIILVFGRDIMVYNLETYICN